MRLLALAFGIVILLAGQRLRRIAQFELSKDQTCSSCHISPAGGGLLNENGMSTAESISKYGTAPEFFYNKLGTPSWLTLGGDLRGAYGFLRAPEEYLVGFPMQTDLYANAKFASNFHAQVTVGYRPPEYGNEAQTYVWSREHYVMWQQHADSNQGLFVRVGRFMPVFGLRFAEHPVYTRQYGGTPLYSETYGAASRVHRRQSGRRTSRACIRDPFIDPVARTR